MVQGKADVPQLSTQQIAAMLKAHKTLTTGLCIHSPLMRRDICQHSIGFPDDTDSHISGLTDLPGAISDRIIELQHNVQTGVP